jgi:hypothetical protein
MGRISTDPEYLDQVVKLASMPPNPSPPKKFQVQPHAMPHQKMEE